MTKQVRGATKATPVKLAHNVQTVSPPSQSQIKTGRRMKAYGDGTNKPKKGMHD